MHSSPASVDSASNNNPQSRANDCIRHTVSVYERTHAARPRIETFVQHAFEKKHGASVRSFLPTLLALEGRDRICGVAGFRNAADEPLFLEQYLSTPIEQALQERMNKPIRRDEIVEVGNLASMSCRAAFHLVAALPRLLTERGHRWIVFTATSAVRGILEQFNAPTIELAVAKSDRVADFGDHWGRYYDNDPRVMAGYLPDGLALQLSREKH